MDFLGGAVKRYMVIIQRAPTEWRLWFSHAVLRKDTWSESRMCSLSVTPVNFVGTNETALVRIHDVLTKCDSSEFWLNWGNTPGPNPIGVKYP